MYNKSWMSQPALGLQGESPREFAKTFDPTSNTDVMKLQGMLGVKEDGILGPETLRALRALQGVMPEEMGEPQKADFTQSVDAGLMSPEEADMLGVAYANTGVSEETDMGSSYGEPAPFEYKTSADIDEPLADFMLRHNMPQRPDMPLDADVDDYSFGTTDSGVGRLERENLDRYWPDTDMSVFRNAMADDSLGDYTELDMDSDSPSTLSGVNSYDPRFMQTPSASRNNLRALINQALNVITRK